MRKCSLLAGFVFIIACCTARVSAQYVYTPFNYPGSVATAPWDINDQGNIVGEYVMARGESSRAFAYLANQFIPIDIPGATGSSALGINENNTIVGYYFDQASALHGFSYANGNAQKYDVAITGTTRTFLTGINNAGHLIGQYNLENGDLASFTDIGGALSIIAYPTGSTFASGINNSDQVVGTYRPGTTSNRGFQYAGGVFATVPVPDLQSEARDINDLGQIVGDFYPAGRRGYLLSESILTEFDYPGPDLGTALLGINNNAVVTGFYQDDSLGFGRALGFMATPIPEPTAMSGVLLILAGLLRIRRRI